jgi:hypothetical protein
MSTSTLTAVAVIPVVAWLLCYLVVVVATRPRRVTAEPATPDLGPEPPAVVNLLVNRWRMTARAAEATLLDLAARGVVELRQTGDDPTHTTVHLRESTPAGLKPFEKDVWDRVRKLSVNGVVPVTALAFRNWADSWHWRSSLRRDVVAEARRLGLSRRRLPRTVVSALLGAAGVAAIGPAVVGFTHDDVRGALGFGSWAWVAMALLVRWWMGERETPDGLVTAGRWLGVREWLRAHDEFANLPPAAVKVWGRYLSYGAALGTTPLTSRVVNLGMGSRYRVWSTYGGRWRRVRVRYPRLRPHSGVRTHGLLVMAAVALLAGTPMLLSGVRSVLTGTDRWLLLGTGAVATTYGGYVVVRAWRDRHRTHTLTGEVLWVRPWRYIWWSKKRGLEPWLDFVAVDDGGADKTTAWALPRDKGAAIPGDVVEITVRPWSRRVLGLRLVMPGPRRATPKRQRAPRAGGRSPEPDPGQPAGR